MLNSIYNECLISIHEAAYVWLLANFAVSNATQPWRECYSAWNPALPVVPYMMLPSPEGLLSPTILGL